MLAHRRCEAVTAACVAMAAVLLAGSQASLAPAAADLTWVEEASRGCLRGRTAVITGATRGIGLAVAHTLASVAGAHTILACRNMTACKLAAQGIQSRSPGASVECLPLNLESLSSVEDFAAQLSPRKGGPRPVHVLVHNAGIMAVEDQATQDGFERTFQVNHLAPFFLTLSLLPNLWAAASSPPTGAGSTSPAPAAKTHVGVPKAKLGAGQAGWGGDVRVVWVSSGLHKFGSVPGSPRLVEEGDGGGEAGDSADDGASGVFRIAFRQRRGMLGRWRAYADSKLLNAMMAAEGARRLEADAQRAGDGGRGGPRAQVPISSVALRPGTVVTDISRDSKVGQVLIGMAQTLGLTRPLPRAAVGILHACTMPLSSPSASTSTPSPSPSAPTESVSAPAPYDIYYDDTQPVQPHRAVLDARSTALAWQHSARLLREWKIRSGQGGGTSEESAPKAEVNIVWGFDLPYSLSTWEDVTFAPASGSGKQLDLPVPAPSSNSGAES